jgi:L-rhamnose mutarotase
MKRYCLALDLKNDDTLIEEYEAYHKQVWPEILQHYKDSGIRQVEIYRILNRLFMVMETDDDFNIEAKDETGISNARIQEWEQLMWKYQQPLPGSRPTEKWILMQKIFDLREQ